MYQKEIQGIISENADLVSMIQNVQIGNDVAGAESMEGSHL